MKNQMRSGRLAKAAVRINIAGIARQILMRTKLRGIDEIADHDAIIFRDRPHNKTLMPLMKIPHGGNKADAQAQTTPFFDLRSDFDDRRNDVHNRSRYAFVLKPTPRRLQ